MRTNFSKPWKSRKPATSATMAGSLSLPRRQFKDFRQQVERDDCRQDAGGESQDQVQAGSKAWRCGRHRRRPRFSTARRRVPFDGRKVGWPERGACCSALMVARRLGVRARGKCRAIAIILLIAIDVLILNW